MNVNPNTTYIVPVSGGKDSQVCLAWAPNRVFAKGFLFRDASWTPDQAEILAGLLLDSARKARGNPTSAA